MKTIWGFLGMVVVWIFASASPCLSVKPLERGVLVRDAEIENILKKLIRPIFQVAGLNPQLAKLYIVIDSDINAAATLGYRIFINSGLLVQSNSVGQVAGVLAHETGHIASGHVMRRMDAMNKASVLRMAAYALGAAVAAITGRAEGFVAAAMGGEQAAMGTVLKYSRGQESAADQAALRYLGRLGWPAQGFLGMMEKLLRQELLSSSHQEPYMRTHPLSQERVNFLRHHVDTAVDHRTMSEDLEKDFILAQAKLKAYTQSPGQTLLEFSEKRQDAIGLYARSIALYRDRRILDALTVLEKVRVLMPTNPYLWEFQGMLLFEEGQMEASRQAYKQALHLAPQEPLIQMAYAQVLLESKSQADIKNAQDLLTKAIEVEDDYSSAWHLLAVAYGKSMQPALAAYALAQEALCLEKFSVASQQIERALKGTLPASIRQKLKDMQGYVQDVKAQTKEGLFDSKEED